MFNVTIIKLRDLIKYVFISILIFLSLYFVLKNYIFDKESKLKKIELGKTIENYINNHVLNYIDKQLPIARYITNESKDELIDENNEDADKDFSSYLFTSMLNLEFGVMDIAKNNTENTNIEENKQSESEGEENNDNNKKDEQITLAKTGVKTEVVTKNPLADAYTNTYNGVKIKNETDFKLTNDILNPDKLKIDSSNIIIFHTHTCESYTSSEKYSYKATGNFRTTDLNYSVARVGDELTKYLNKYGYNTIHDKTYHDYPAYTGSYNRSLDTVTKILKNKKSDIIIDLHRDAIGSYSSYAPTVKIGEDYCAQVMFVMGSNGGGLKHPNWNSNLKFAVKMQQVANELYPGLFKPIILRNSRYNQHLSNAACIIEVGSTGNTLEQCLNSMKYLSEVINTAFPKS